jgi:hypothetical protein
VTYWALADIWSEYIAYVRGYEGECTLELGDASRGRRYAVRRFDLRTGEYTALPDHVGAGAVTLTAPDEDDWVFDVRARPGG